MSEAPAYETIIIGAGMSGLAAGIRLAQFDQRVLILEKHYLWGGLNSFYKREGRRLDVGLHALTNYVPRGTRGTPLMKMLRQLRLRYDDLQLAPQSYSEIAFPGKKLRFSNDFALLESQVAEAFPHQRDAFQRLIREVDEYDSFTPPDTTIGARAVLGELLSDPLLIEMLLLPTCYYGSAREDDVDWYQFAILFQSLFQEGFARPEGGIKPLLDLLVARYREQGGELLMRSGVQELLVEDRRCRGVRLEDGNELLADRVFSSAGWVETMRLAGPEYSDPAQIEASRGRLSFVESLFVLDQPTAALGTDATIIFFNDAEELAYRRPETLTDPRSGVICCPDNYATSTPPEEGVFRTTTLANHELWCALDEEEYAAKKLSEVNRNLETVARYSFDPLPHTRFRDSFTPRTIERFSGKLGGAVYGSPTKRLDGSTPIDGLHLVGTDQGLLGVTGAMLSGITMANQHALLRQS